MAETFRTSIDLAPEVRGKLIARLNQQLADSFDLMSQIKQCHWNVKGMQFHQLHLLFDSLADQVEEFVDDIAERAVQLGGTALGTARMAAAASRLPECPEKVGGRKSVEILVERFAMLCKSTREAIDDADRLGDKDTADLYTEVSRGLDKSLWFLEAHVQE